ncbi:MAG: succinylglutamate desuccinylase/aspartoacylase family protein [Clostridium sp.]|nr:succinylglutamate desuccinylase/aspartoacylase family protein [Clostridium sp.]MCM1398096.1 succinylglutamate desuccinylase/aspartoacylase family protein [Clostridium sp.]MCM1459270.1 succinylglutamate desuccinylase/aspartoacylase family protein [Bacteroides sp.]
MNKEVIFSMNTAFRGEYVIHGYSYGRGEQSACIVGAMRGNEYQQLYICSLLAKKLAELEAQGSIASGKEILLIPTLNYSSMNAKKKRWISDDSDINRSFPGNPKGPATSRIAATLLERIKNYSYGIQFSSFYLQGRSIPHVRMMATGKESASLANLFGMPYVVTGENRAFDKVTLNYNLQLQGTQAFSVYSSTTETIDDASANMAVSSVLRFLTRMGIIKYDCHGGYISTIINESALVSIKADEAGFFRKLVEVDSEVKRGQVLAEIVNPMDGSVKAEIVASTDGIVFFVQDAPMVFQNVVVYKIIRRIHR